MTVAEKIVLREDVSAPSARAAVGVERLAGALGDLGSAKIDAGAAIARGVWAELQRLAEEGA
ncbi:hypothetical protein [Polyangium jinanense]|uniref:Uncharacterized protein n=1 Tax=Polyangium jinanense TaxID=2829994 RepID=A0A9X3XBM9_9BACT|nr:hypothetical protein [Polyangium jinanense]MDC3985788.1 hypothetical protein [Polyangium jinanense]